MIISSTATRMNLSGWNKSGTRFCRSQHQTTIFGGASPTYGGGLYSGTRWSLPPCMRLGFKHSVLRTVVHGRSSRHVERLRLRPAMQAPAMIAAPTSNIPMQRGASNYVVSCGNTSAFSNKEVTVLNVDTTDRRCCCRLSTSRKAPNIGQGPSDSSSASFFVMGHFFRALFDNYALSLRNHCGLIDPVRPYAAKRC